MFVNNGNKEHTATADNEVFDTGALKPRESTWVFFRGSGTVTYHDQLHPDMKGIIDVGEGVGGEGAGGGDIASQKRMAEEAPNEPSIEAAKPATEADKILAPEADKPLRG